MKKYLFIIIVALMQELMPTIASGQELITNGNLEGSDMTCFRVNDYLNNQRREIQEPRIITDDTLNHYIVVTTNQNARNVYDSQLFLSFTEPLSEPCGIKLSMKVKADLSQTASMELHSTPSNYVTYSNVNISFTTEWTPVEYTFFIGDTLVRTLAIDLSTSRVNNLYFDDISAEIVPNMAPPELVSFRVKVPEGPVVQGDRIQIVYTLVSTNYSIKNFDGGIEGGKLEKIDRKTSNNMITGTVVTTADYTLTKTGKIKVLPMSATVSGVTVYSDSAFIDVLPNSDFGIPWSIAEQFLIERGVKSPILVYKYGLETLCALSDDKQECFVVVVSEKYLPYVDNPILAYSIGESMWGSKNKDTDNSIYAIIALYDYQLKYLSSHNQVYKSELKSIYIPKSEKLEPLLGDIKYNQRYPFNKLFPYDINKDNGQKEQCLAGCGPIALAQVLSYYHHPITLKGKRAFTTKTGKKYRKDLSEYQIKWDGTEYDIANLIYACAISVSADMSPTATSSKTVLLKEALVKYWGYSHNCRFMEDYYDYSKLASIYNELDNNRPIIISDTKHLFVCDGYENEYLHYNLGWGGIYNGYYRAMIVPSMFGKGQIPFKEIIIGISPRKK